MKHKKRCPYCGDWFIPNPRTSFQKACLKPSCRKKRKIESQNNWLKKNPGFFRGHVHYLQQKAWLAKHPGYLTDYRATHPEYMEKKRLKERLRRRRLKRRRVDMKDTIRRREIEAIKAIRGVDMKDTIRLKLDGVLNILPRIGRVGMKDNMDYRFDTG